LRSLWEMAADAGSGTLAGVVTKSLTTFSGYLPLGFPSPSPAGRLRLGKSRNCGRTR
jgi:hypothetical protein